jgi:hypothetical protein
MSTVTFHSYQGQDRFVVSACRGQRGGFFLDSGASDGVRGSNTLTLERDFGWRGICVEPNDALYARLIRNRSCICLNCCLYDRDQGVEFYEAAQVYGGIVEHYDPGHLRFARRFAANHHDGSCLPTVTKPALPVRSILRQYGAPRVIDYWSLDTEGSELVILRGFPFDEYRVRFLTVEHNHTSIRSEIADLLTAEGMRRVADLGIDDGYAWTGDTTGGARRSAAWRSAAWRRARPGDTTR